MKIDEFVKDNIEEINNKISKFKKSNGYEYDDTDIKNYLSSKFYAELDVNQELWISEFKDSNYSKDAIITIANKYCLYSKNLEEYLKNNILEKCKQSISNELVKKIFAFISQNAGLEEKEASFVSSTLKMSLNKFLFLSAQNGFINNLNNLNSGTMIANAGDSAQFLFLSRAILAGYNCSNVDVRSSRYDVIIDYDDTLFRVQVKGISGTTVYFKDRPRGGRGIDYKDETNQGKYISVNDCDIYVAVDKQSGICYLIPTEDISIIDSSKSGKANVKQLCQYKENWKVIKELHEKMMD